MHSPLDRAPLLQLDSVDSTQNVARAAVEGNRDPVGIILAREQTQGIGRHGRTWHSQPDASFTASMVFWEYANHPKPWLVGMSVAVAAASALHCRVSWPNDLVYGGKKLGGVITELVTDPKGRRIPVVGVGINLSVKDFPAELDEIAVNLCDIHHHSLSAKEILDALLERLLSMPEPESWAALRPVWHLFDTTPGKRYTLANGEIAVGIGLGPEGELIAAVDGETTTVLAADAWFGDSVPR